MPEKCGSTVTRVEGTASRSGPKSQKKFIQNIARNLATNDAHVKIDRFVNLVKCKFTCPVKTYSADYFDRTETESTNPLTGIYTFTITIRFDVTVKCSRILNVPLKKK